MPTNPFFRDNLLEIASLQEGYFTTAQANEAGYSNQAQQRHIQSGTWKRVLRGVYRLEALPHSDKERYFAWLLWAGDEAVVSHESAAKLWGMGNLEDWEVHLTVPETFGKRPPSITPGSPNALLTPVHLHVGTVEHFTHHTIPATTPLRTISDLAAENLGADHLSLLIADGLRLRLFDTLTLRRTVAEAQNAALQQALTLSEKIAEVGLE